MKMPNLSLGKTSQTVINAESDVQSGIHGPPMPKVMQNSPGQDVGRLVTGFIGDVQGVGKMISDTLDIPFDKTVKIQGPHRVIDGYLNKTSGMVKNFIKDATHSGYDY
jgi:hypothetical protein